jgi:predicted RNA-binding protein YlxR (DUF448 family)
MAVERPQPARTCVACRAGRAKRDLVRVVRAPDGSILFDPTGRLAGRGAYLCADAACWRLAVRRSSLERALGVTLPPELRSRLETGGPEELQGGPHGP